jgi:hypothetical protein
VESSSHARRARTIRQHFSLDPPARRFVRLWFARRLWPTSFAERHMKSSPDEREATAAHRKSHEPPDVVARRGWRYHHLGIPTDVPRAGEIYLERFGLYVSGFPTSPYGIEWMRFEASSPLHPLIKSLPHVAFEVDDLDAALVGQDVISPPGSPSDGVRAAMIVVDGAPVELIWFRKQGG